MMVNTPAPAGGAPAILQKSGGAFGIPELRPPARRQMIRENLHAPAADAPAVPQKSGGAFGIPEYMPPNRRQDFQGKNRIECSSETVFCSRSVSRKGCRRLEDTVFCCGVNAPAAHFITKYPARRALSDWILLKNVVAATYFSAETVYDTVH